MESIFPLQFAQPTEKMKTTKSILLILFTICVSKGFGQTSDSTYHPKSEIKLSLLGSIKYPGLRLGVELPLRLKEVIKTKKPKTIYKVRSLTFNAGYYHQKDFHDNFYFTAEWQMRRICEKGWFSEFAPGIGYSRTFLGGTTYTVGDNGVISIHKFAGFNYAVITLAAGFGYDFSLRKSAPLKIFGKLSMLSMFPYNNRVYLRPTIETGIVYAPKAFLKTKPSIKTKLK